MYTLQDPGGISNTLIGMEFSPDSKFLYLGSQESISANNSIYQFDMQEISDETMFSNSGKLVSYWFRIWTSACPRWKNI